MNMIAKFNQPLLVQQKGVYEVLSQMQMMDDIEDEQESSPDRPNVGKALKIEKTEEQKTTQEFLRTINDLK